MNEFIMVSKNEIELRKNAIILNEIEAEELIEYRDIFIKFLDKTRLSYQIELSKWTFRWDEEKLYRSMKTIEEIKQSLEDFLLVFKEFKNKK